MNQNLPQEIQNEFLHFKEKYIDICVKGGSSREEAEARLNTFLKLIQEQVESPFKFPYLHKAALTPFDFFSFGQEMLRPLINFTQSKIKGLENLRSIENFLQQGHNVVIFSNHQAEADPIVISLLLEDIAPELSKNMIYVAGHRVTHDPMAIPFSLGRNLICIYAKKYINNPPEQKQEKMFHNVRAIKATEHMLTEGGKCIYIAPSGGRDRKNPDGSVSLSTFDPDSIDLFALLAKKSKTPCHFFSLALWTYSILPPPETTKEDLGEERNIFFAPCHLFVGKEIDMHAFDALPKKELSEQRAASIYAQTLHNYKEIIDE